MATGSRWGRHRTERDVAAKRVDVIAVPQTDRGHSHCRAVPSRGRPGSPPRDAVDQPRTGLDGGVALAPTSWQPFLCRRRARSSISRTPPLSTRHCATTIVICVSSVIVPTGPSTYPLPRNEVGQPSVPRSATSRRRASPGRPSASPIAPRMSAPRHRAETSIGDADTRPNSVAVARDGAEGARRWRESRWDCERRKARSGSSQPAQCAPTAVRGEPRPPPVEHTGADISTIRCTTECPTFGAQPGATLPRRRRLHDDVPAR